MYPKILKKQSFNIVFIVMNPFPTQLSQAETNQGRQQLRQDLPFTHQLPNCELLRLTICHTNPEECMRQCNVRQHKCASCNNPKRDS